MIWILTVIISVSLIVIALTTKDKIRKICLKVCFTAMAIFLIVGTTEIFYGDVFRISVSVLERDYKIAEFEKSVTLDETVYIIRIEDSNIKYIISDNLNNIEADYKNNPARLTVTKNKILDLCTLKTEEKKIYKVH